MTEHISQIVDRLEQLEKQNRRLKLTGALLAIIVLSFLSMGLISQEGKLLEAENFLLRDKEGRVRAAFFLNEAGGVGITLLNSSSQERLTMGVEQNGNAFLRLVDDNGKPRLSLANDRTGTGIILTDRFGEPRASLSESNNEYRLNLSGKKGSISLFTTNSEIPGLILYDANQKKRFQVGVNHKGEPGLILNDPNEKPRLLLGVSGYYGEPILSLLASDGSPLFAKP